MGEIADALRQADRSSAEERTPVAPVRTEAKPDIDPAAVLRHARPAPAREARPKDRDEAADPSDETRAGARIAGELRTADVTGQLEAARLRVSILEDLAETTDPTRASLREPHSATAQQYRRLALKVSEMAESRRIGSIVVTSAEALDGKTTTSCNLAFQLCRLDQLNRVVLVDLDLHRASVAKGLGLEVPCPLSNVLRGEVDVADALLDTDLPGLSLLLEQEPSFESEFLLAQAHLKTMLRELQKRFDYIIIDTPPVLATSDAQVILRYVDAGLLVARAGQTRTRAIRNAIELVPPRKLLGTVLNSSPKKDQRSYYAYYGQGSQAQGGQGRDDAGRARGGDGRDDAFGTAETEGRS